MTSGPQAIRVFLCGDVMTGRGIDQILPHPGTPTLHESYVHDARDYVALAEKRRGAIPRPVDPAYPWGDALALMTEADVRIINLETSITTSDAAWPGKGIHYRMHPQNIGCLAAARIDCCSLANNHVLDWGYRGLEETIRTLDAAGIARAGAGRNATEASAPGIVEVPAKGRVLVFGVATETSGVPLEWAATEDRPGISFLPDLSEDTARIVAGRIRAYRRDGDQAIVSIHWGPNWGYQAPERAIAFARRLVSEGVAVVHGHSSHHPLGIDVHRERLILYGCGDFIDDYEGISGYEAYRPDLRLMYQVQLEAATGRLEAARLVPFQTQRLQLRRSSELDATWTCQLLDELGAPFGTHVRRDDHTLRLDWR